MGLRQRLRKGRIAPDKLHHPAHVLDDVLQLSDKGEIRDRTRQQIGLRPPVPVRMQATRREMVQKRAKTIGIVPREPGDI